MKNHQYIRNLSVKELAKLLVKEEEHDEGDYDCDDNPISFYVTRYLIPDGSYSYDFDDAVKYTIDWLNAERKSDCKYSVANIEIGDVVKVKGKYDNDVQIVTVIDKVGSMSFSHKNKLNIVSCHMYEDIIEKVK